jgi:hypothetical protein
LLISDSADFQKFDVPNLRGISRTAPYFINNSAKTLEDVLQQYRAFFAQINSIVVAPGGIDGCAWKPQPLPRVPEPGC